MLFLEFSFNYIYTNLSIDPSDTFKLTMSHLDLISGILMIICLYYFSYKMICEIQQKKPLISFKYLISGSIIILGVFLFIEFFTPIPVYGVYILGKTNETINYLGRFMIISMILYTYYWGRKLEPAKQKKALYRFLSIFVFLFGLLFILQTAIFYSLLPSKALSIVTPFIYLYANIVPVLYLKKFQTDYFDQPLHISIFEHIDTLGSFESICDSYGLTPREREVINLIIQGKSNQEISDLLFIELQSVKDHNYPNF